MKRFPFLSLSTCLKIFRIGVSVFLLIHGTTRIMHGAVDGFGAHLASLGLGSAAIGISVAWSITLFEILGACTLILGYFVSWISLLFILELLMGIVLVHYHNGWFVVGGGTAGMEYSVLLILSFFLIASTDKKAG